MVDTPAQRLAALRGAMQQQGLAACVVLSSDPHLSEYLPGHWQARAWLSGFDGSAGTLAVTADDAGLWTDSRYWEQAGQQLQGSGIRLMRAGAEGVPTLAGWLAATLPQGAKVATDGMALSLQTRSAWQEEWRQAQLELVTDIDLPGQIWAGRPAVPLAPVYEHEAPFACRSRADNLRQVREAMAQQGAAWHWLSTLDDIAWLLNLRGGDVDYNPVFLAHLLLGPDTAQLFVAPGKIDADLAARLSRDGIALRPYDEAPQALAHLPQGDVLLLDPARVTVGLVQGASVSMRHAPNPTQLLKACKTEAESRHVRQAMEQDGAALCEFFAWFEAAQGREPITELTIDERITAARARRPHFVCPSFPTIAAFNANGAMPHYQATAARHATIEGDGLLLIDSGGQYLGGTTDITRVVPVGTPSAEQRRDYTRVLQGMIALSRAVFPRGTPAPLLDAIARAPIWRDLGEYGHGTGHGVGYFLNVHEGPQAISYRTPVKPQMAMQPGMITSNEPGLYRPGRWGIRIENLVQNRTAGTSEFGEFLCFETLTLCPIDTRCVEVELLEASERRWLNDYHAQVRERLAPLLDGAALEWLQARTQEI